MQQPLEITPGSVVIDIPDTHPTGGQASGATPGNGLRTDQPAWAERNLRILKILGIKAGRTMAWLLKWLAVLTPFWVWGLLCGFLTRDVVVWICAFIGALILWGPWFSILLQARKLVRRMMLWPQRMMWLRASRRAVMYTRNNLTCLPDPALGKIVFQYSSMEDKKALRLTCRYFRHMLDSAMTTAVMSSSRELLPWRQAYYWLWRMRQVSQLRSLVLPWHLTNKQQLNYGRCVPKGLTTLVLIGYRVRLDWLQYLPSLACLRTGAYECFGGRLLAGCSNLTRLEAPTLSGVKLPKTLRHLSIRGSTLLKSEVLHLTNLRVLVLTRRSKFPQPMGHYSWVISQLPLEHLTWPVDCRLDSPDTLRHLPRTLTSVSFSDIDTAWVLDSLSMPTGITRLQLLNLKSCTAIQTFAQAAPNIAQLDISILWGTKAIASITGVSKFLSLRSLKLYIQLKQHGDDRTVHVLNKDLLYQKYPEVEHAPAIGVAVEVCNHASDLDPYRHRWPEGPEWSASYY